jgi:hypothetical protein
MRIILEKTKLEDVRKRFSGVLGYRGDASQALAWLCLFGNDASGGWVFWPTSGEMGGTSVIDGFQWRRLSSHERPDHRCRLLPSESGGVQLPISLHLGSSEEEVRHLLGRPTWSRGNLMIFDHEHSVIIRQENWIASNTVAFLIRDGSVWAIEASKITSN